MRMSGNQISLIVDEFGGIAGLITLKNLLTELAGQVGEEGEAPEEEFEAINKFTFKVDGGMDINEAKEGNYRTPEEYNQALLEMEEHILYEYFPDEAKQRAAEAARAAESMEAKQAREVALRKQQSTVEMPKDYRDGGRVRLI